VSPERSDERGRGYSVRAVPAWQQEPSRLITLSQSSKFSPEIATTTAIIAGGATNRSVTAWKQLEADIRAGKVTKLVCWKLDRLGRTACELLALRDELLQRKVDLICVMSGMMGLDSPEGRMMFSVIASFAEYEREVRRERQAAGIAAAKERGVYKGRKTGTRKAKPQRALKRGCPF